MTTTYAITREPLGVPTGTLAPEHVATVERQAVNRTLRAHGVAPCHYAAADPRSIEGSLSRLAIGENITRNGPTYRYSITRES